MHVCLSYMAEGHVTSLQSCLHAYPAGRRSLALAALELIRLPQCKVTTLPPSLFLLIPVCSVSGTQSRLVCVISNTLTFWHWTSGSNQTTDLVPSHCTQCNPSPPPPPMRPVLSRRNSSPRLEYENDIHVFAHRVFITYGLALGR